MDRTRTAFALLIGLALLALVAAAEAALKFHSLSIRGHVVDDETGLPIVRFVQQAGQSSAKEPNKIVWGSSLSTTDSPRNDGAFNDNLGWQDGLKAWSRIMADDYLPEPIRATPFATEDGRIEGLVVRLKRGRKVEGQVIGHDGKTVAGARVFLFGSQPLTITDGQAMDPTGRGPTRGVSRGMTDAQGRFSLLGAGGDVNQVVVTAPACNLWPTPIPAPGQDDVIRLPQTGGLNFRYDIDGDDPNAEFALQLSPTPFEQLTSFQNLKLANKSSLALPGLIPATYELAKVRKVSMGSGSRVLFGDSRTITIKAGETATTDFVRDHGARVTIEINGLERLKVPGATILIQRGDERLLKRPRHSFEDFVDAMDCDAKGRCRTPKLAPGLYTIVVEAYRPGSPDGRFGGGIQGPDYRAIAIVTIAKDGPEPKVEIAMTEAKPNPRKGR
jgi:hypothetical protein